MLKKKKEKPTMEEMAAEVSHLVDKGEATSDALRAVSEKYDLDRRQAKILDGEYLKIPLKTKA
jgi:hypothetical protein